MSKTVYCTIDELTDYMGLSAQESTDDSSKMVQMIKRASRKIDATCGRIFYPQVKTHYYDYPDGASNLFLKDDLLSITAFIIDGENIAPTKYFLYPDNPPYYLLQMDKGGNTYFGWTDTPQRAISIVGLWGFHQDYAAAWETTGVAVGNTTQISSSGTVLTVSSTSPFEKLQTIKIDSEMCLITDIGTSFLTIERAINSSTAEAHLNGAAIYIYRPEYVINQAAVRMATWYYRQREAPFEQTAAPEVGQIVVPIDIPEDVKEILSTFKKIRVGV